MRLAQDGEDTEEWWVDATGAATVEIAAALGVSRSRAGSHVRYARALREQLPLLGRGSWPATSTRRCFGRRRSGPG